MIEWIVAGLIGSYVYGQYSNAKSKQNSFETNSTKKYSQYGTLTLTRRKKEMIEILMDGYLFVKINPAGINSTGIDIVNVYNVPVGGELTSVIVPLTGQKRVETKYIVTQNMLHNVSSTKQVVPNHYMGSDMSI